MTILLSDNGIYFFLQLGRTDTVFDATLKFETIRTWWIDLESGWQAVCLGFLLLIFVSLGVPIPW